MNLRLFFIPFKTKPLYVGKLNATARDERTNQKHLSVSLVLFISWETYSTGKLNEALANFTQVKITEV